MARQTTYITTAIAYPNGSPHIGHAYESAAADVLARFNRLNARDTFFLTGTDEHGLKMQKTAQDLGKEVRAVADDNVTEFKRMDRILDISYDRFIRTTDEDHYSSAQHLWNVLFEAGDIYKDQYSGWYSIRDEAFYTQEETYINDLGVRLAKSTDTEVEWTQEESYFFRLSRYQDQLLELYQNNPEFLQPASRMNEIRNFVESGLQDLSISRTTFDWGIPVPDQSNHVMYVWIDALANYLTGAGYPNTDSEQFQSLWPPKVQIIGKDITRFHAVYWPAFLISAGIELPERIFAHGFLNVDGEKMSKSKGNVVSPFSLVDTFGLDPFRYFLLREVPFGQDGSYSEEAIIQRINADLANDLGNLTQRSLSMIYKNLQGELAQSYEHNDADMKILRQANDLKSEIIEDYENLAFHRLLEKIWKVISETNKYFTEQEPWVLRKTDESRMAAVLATTHDILRRVAILLQPVMPESMEKLLDQLGVDEKKRQFVDYDDQSNVLLPGAPTPLFSKIDPDDLD